MSNAGCAGFWGWAGRSADEACGDPTWDCSAARTGAGAATPDKLLVGCLLLGRLPLWMSVGSTTLSDTMQGPCHALRSS